MVAVATAGLDTDELDPDKGVVALGEATPVSVGAVADDLEALLCASLSSALLSEDTKPPRPLIMNGASPGAAVVVSADIVDVDALPFELTTTSVWPPASVLRATTVSPDVPTLLAPELCRVIDPPSVRV